MNLNFNPTAEQTLALSACMLAISNVDGVHPAESALIEGFYSSGNLTEMNELPVFSSFDDLHLQATSLLEKLTPDVEFTELLVALCLMTGYADGTLSDTERNIALRFATSLGVTTERFDEQLQSVRDSLLGAFAQLPDAGSVASLAKEL